MHDKARWVNNFNALFLMHFYIIEYKMYFISSMMCQKELALLDDNCKTGLTRLDDKEQKEITFMAVPLNTEFIVPNAFYHPAKLLPFSPGNFHMLRAEAARTLSILFLAVATS
jgi:hypothetical protein